MWKTPIYKLKQPVLKGDDNAYREIVIDVTRSAPPFDEPGKTLAAALKKAIRESGLRKTDQILDFGAGKLRNTQFLLDGGYQVCAVEYKELFDGTQAASALSQARRHRKRFSTLVYPHQFIRATAKFDFVALINVLNIMPVPIERLKVLLYCHQRLNPNGHIFWYTQRGDASYRNKLVPKYQIGDGYFLGQNAYHKTFYREWTVAEIDKMLADTGFELVSPIPASSRNQCRLYRRKATAPLASQLRNIDLGTANLTDERIPDPIAVKPRVVTGRPRTRKGDPDPPGSSVRFFTWTS